MKHVFFNFNLFIVNYHLSFHGHFKLIQQKAISNKQQQ